MFGFAFYIQPMMMPLLLEMPEGKVGVKLTSWSARIVVLGIYHLAKLTCTLSKGTAVRRQLLHTTIAYLSCTQQKHLEVVCRSEAASLR